MLMSRSTCCLRHEASDDSEKGDPQVAAGRLAQVGPVCEHLGITGLGHRFEHGTLKGTSVIDQERKLVERLDAVKAEIRNEGPARIDRPRLGLIADLSDPASRSARRSQILRGLDRIEKESQALIVGNEFDKIDKEVAGGDRHAGPGRHDLQQ